jgi:glycosyltransferase involved in cell wall biosynthesis
VSEIVSCIIPTANRPTLLKRAIDSVVSQTYDNIEIIIVASPPHDIVRPVISKYNDCEVPIDAIYIEDDSGPSAARNRGIDAANGEYIAFLDDDDEWRPNKLEQQVPYLTEYSIVSCLSIIRTADGKTRQQKSGRVVGHVDLETAFADFSTIYPSGAVFRTDELRAVDGFDEDLTRGDTYDLALDIMSRCDDAYVLDQHLVVFDREHEMGRVSEVTDDYDKRLEAYDRHRNKVPPDTARRRLVKLKYIEYTELDDLHRYRPLIQAITKDYELYVSRQLVKSMAIYFRNKLLR